MSSQLQITTQLNNSTWVITATVLSGGTLPQNIFVYCNTGTTTLGNYIGVCNISELTRLQVWSGAALPVFGNKFVLSNQAKINISIQEELSSVTQNLINTATLLSQEIQAQGNSTETVTIN
jgi:hypothetical protein